MLQRGFYPALRRAGLRHIRFHDLRHTHASALILSGVNVKTVQLRLGHSSAMMTLDTYSHLWPDSDDEATRAIEGFVSFGETCNEVATPDEEVYGKSSQVLENLVARGRIELPTRGFSVRCSTN